MSADDEHLARGPPRFWSTARKQTTDLAAVGSWAAHSAQIWAACVVIGLEPMSMHIGGDARLARPNAAHVA